MPYYSEKFLKSMLGLGDAPGAKIEKDRPCAGCGYNLRGLTFGRACPECGQPIRRATESGPADDLIGRGDSQLRRRMQLGLGMGAACLAFAAIARWLSLFFAAFVLGQASPVYFFGMLANGAVWVVAVWIITPADIDRLWPRLQPLRWFVRLSQILWPIALGLFAFSRLATMSPTLKDQLFAIQLIGRLVAGIGVMLLVWLMYVMAQGAELEKSAKRLYNVLWGLPIFTLLAGSFPSQFWWIFLTLLGLMLIGWTWMMAWFALALWDMQNHAGWSLRHMHDLAGRDSRVARKWQELEEESAGRVRPVPNREATDVPFDS